MVQGERWGKGTGSKRPRVRCSECGTRLIVKSRDVDPLELYGPYNSPIWVLPRHKTRVGAKKVPRQLAEISTRELLGMRDSCRVRQSSLERRWYQEPTSQTVNQWEMDPHGEKPLEDWQLRCSRAQNHKPGRTSIGDAHPVDMCKALDCQGACFPLTAILAELGTREHIPNKKERKELRKQKVREGRASGRKHSKNLNSGSD